MIYVLSAVTAILLTAFFTAYMKKTGYFTFKEAPSEGTIGGPEGENNLPGTGEKSYGKKQSLLLTLLFAVLAAVVNFLAYKYSYEMNEINLAVQPMIFFKLAAAHAVCACAALTDYKRCRIPNTLIISGLISRAGIYVFEFILAKDFFGDILLNDALGFAIGFVLLFTVAVITKGGIGMGDVKLFGVIGLLMGSAGMFNVLFLSLLFSSISSVFMLVRRKKTLKSSLPMAPFIYLGFAAAVITGVF